MLVFGKKCPACGGKHLTAQSPRPGIASLPIAKAFSCRDCQRMMAFVFPFSISIENRHNARKKLPPFFLIRIHGRADQYARIKNISKGGICFTNHYNAAPITGRFLKLDLYNCNDGSSLEHLPAEIIATSEQLLDINGVKTTMLNNRVRFVGLNQAQEKILMLCIAQHGTS